MNLNMAIIKTLLSFYDYVKTWLQAKNPYKKEKKNANGDQRNPGEALGLH